MCIVSARVVSRVHRNASHLTIEKYNWTNGTWFRHVKATLPDSGKSIHEIFNIKYITMIACNISHHWSRLCSRQILISTLSPKPVKHGTRKGPVAKYMFISKCWCNSLVYWLGFPFDGSISAPRTATLASTYSGDLTIGSIGPIGPETRNLTHNNFISIVVGN